MKLVGAGFKSSPSPVFFAQAAVFRKTNQPTVCKLWVQQTGRDSVKDSKGIWQQGEEFRKMKDVKERSFL